jgi:hypothetical protein
MFRAALIVSISALAARAQTTPPNGPYADDSRLARLLRPLEPATPGPLTAQERLKLYVSSSVGPWSLLSDATVAGIGQLRGTPVEWGQGASGYAKRLGNSIGYNCARFSITYVAELVTGEDNRYFASGRSGFWRRVEHAVASSVTARREDGSTSVSISGIAGVVGAAGISVAWAPPSWQGFQNVAERSVITFAGRAGLNVVREFTPDLIRKRHK